MMDLEQMHHALEHTHREMLEDSTYAAEGLEGASCPPHRKHLAQLAAGAAAQGMDAQTWRSQILRGIGPGAQPLLDSAESCMRESGLWPWPG